MHSLAVCPSPAPSCGTESLAWTLCHVWRTTARVYTCTIGFRGIFVKRMAAKERLTRLLSDASYQHKDDLLTLEGAREAQVAWEAQATPLDML